MNEDVLIGLVFITLLGIIALMILLISMSYFRYTCEICGKTKFGSKFSVKYERKVYGISDMYDNGMLGDHIYLRGLCRKCAGNFATIIETEEQVKQLLKIREDIKKSI